MTNTLSHFCSENPETFQNIYNIINIKTAEEYLLYHNKTLTTYEILNLLTKQHHVYKNIHEKLSQYFPYTIFTKINIQTFIILIHISLENISNIIINIDNDKDTDKDNNNDNENDNTRNILDSIKDIKYFYPNLVINVFIFTPIDEKYAENFQYIDNLYCRKTVTYNHYTQIKSNTECVTKRFPKLFYIKFKNIDPQDIQKAHVNDITKLLLQKYKKGITFGTFDLFHFGHDNILKRCRNFCDHLCLGLSSDELNIKKGKRSVYDYERRREMIKTSTEKYVDMIFKEEYLEYKDQYIVENDCDILMMGDDWLEKFDWVSCSVLYMERTPNISTTMLKESMNIAK